MAERDPQDSDLEQLGVQLTRIERLLAIGFAPQVEATRERAGVGDEVTTVILSGASCWTSAGALKGAAKEATGQSDSTIKRRLGRLVELGALVERGTTSDKEYRSTGFLG
jgi:hypothetical protein